MSQSTLAAILFVGTGCAASSVPPSGQDASAISDMASTVDIASLTDIAVARDIATPPDLAQRPESYFAYTFDEAGAAMIVDHSTDTTRAGMVQGTAAYGQGAAGRGVAASFNGSWRILVNNSKMMDFALSGVWTLAFSVFPTAQTNWGNGLAQRLSDDSGTCGYRGLIVVDDARLRVTAYDSNYNPNSGAGSYSALLSTLVVGQWNRVVIVHSAGMADIYVNGTKTTAGMAFPIAETNEKQMSIGGNYINLGCYSDAFANNVLVDDFVLLKAAATGAQVQSDSLQHPIGF